MSQVAHCIVARLEGRPIGYILSVFTPNMKSATIQALCVHPRARMQGVGETLLNWAEIEALQSGASHISAEAQFDNVAIMHLLEENGYIECYDPLILIPVLTEGTRLRKRLIAEFCDTVYLENTNEIEISALNVDHFNILSR